MRIESYHRPTTRGELVQCLRDGIRCEVVTDNVEITCLLIHGWIKNLPEYTVRDSDNEHWSVFEPKLSTECVERQA